MSSHFKKSKYNESLNKSVRESKVKTFKSKFKTNGPRRIVSVEPHPVSNIFGMSRAELTYLSKVLDLKL